MGRITFALVVGAAWLLLGHGSTSNGWIVLLAVIPGLSVMARLWWPKRRP